VVESIRSVVGERKDSRSVLLVSESAWNQLEIIFETKVLRLFVDHLLKTSNRTDCHLNADHHVEHKIPIIISQEDHLSLTILHIQPFVHVLGCFILPLSHLLSLAFEFLSQ
jgi:hypothetical protein